MSISLILRRVGLVLTSLLAVGGILFALGYAFDDPGGWAAVGLTVAVLVPLIALVLLAVYRPEVATTVLTWAVVLYAVWAAVTLIFDPVDAPTLPIIALVLVAPIAVVGQRKPWLAGVLLLATAVIPLVVVLIEYFTESARDGLGSLFGTSTGVVVLPLVILGVLFLVAGSTHPAHELEERPPARPMPPAGLTR